MASLSDWFKLGLTKPSGTDYEEHSAVGDLSTGRRYKAVGIPPLAFQQALDVIREALEEKGEEEKT